MTGPAIQRARAACAELEPVQRIAFAIELVRDIQDIGCEWHLLRLARAAEATSQTIARKRFTRDT